MQHNFNDTETDVDGHYWHSRDYVARWIWDREEAASPGYQAIQREKVARILQSIPGDPEARREVLDLGVGWGRLARHVLDRFPNARVVGIDFSGPMLEEGKIRLAPYGERVLLLRGALEDPATIGDLQNRYDAVVTAATLHHLSRERLATLYREVHAVLQPGGVFLNLDLVRRSRALPARLANRLAIAAGWGKRPGKRRRGLRRLADQTAYLIDCFLASSPVTEKERTHGVPLAQHLHMLEEAGFITYWETAVNEPLMVGTKPPDVTNRS